MIKKIVSLAVVLAIVVIGFILVATIDSCNRHADTRPCFGSSGK